MHWVSHHLRSTFSVSSFPLLPADIFFDVASSPTYFNLDSFLILTIFLIYYPYNPNFISHNRVVWTQISLDEDSASIFMWLRIEAFHHNMIFSLNWTSVIVKYKNYRIYSNLSKGHELNREIYFYQIYTFFSWVFVFMPYLSI